MRLITRAYNDLVDRGGIDVEIGDIADQIEVGVEFILMAEWEEYGLTEPYELTKDDRIYLRNLA